MTRRDYNRAPSRRAWMMVTVLAVVALLLIMVKSYG